MRDRRTQAAALAMAALSVVGAVVVFAGSNPMPAAKAAMPHAENMLWANSLAVCGCGKVFRPDAKTEYISYGGKQYACCSHECHEMAMKAPADAAAMSEKQMAATIEELMHLNLGVANVIAVTEQGTRALCGCGKEFMIDPMTKYLEVDGKSYACCSPGCHDMAAKDPAASVKMFEAKLASR
jgi:YHS domain-containing protein